MRWVMSVLLLVAAVGCGGGDGGMSALPDGAAGAQDAISSSDGAAFQPGLTIQWVDLPALPGPVSATVTVTSAVFHVEKLEVIGDAGDPAETTKRDYKLTWNATQSPFDDMFINAPPAIYSKVRIGLDKGSSNAPAFEITGTVVIGGASEPFHITSLKKIDLEVTGYNVNLPVNGSADITVMVGLDDALQNVNWMALPTTNSTRILEDSAPTAAAMDALVDDLEETFTRPGS
jgi:hypothetical protein